MPQRLQLHPTFLLHDVDTCYGSPDATEFPCPKSKCRHVKTAFMQLFHDLFLLCSSAQHGWLLTCANLGDSRAIVDTGREVTVLTDDHRVASHKLERRRLEKKGAVIAPVDIGGAANVYSSPAISGMQPRDSAAGAGRVLLGTTRCTDEGMINCRHWSRWQAGGRRRARAQWAWDRCGCGPVACACRARLVTLTWATPCFRCPTSAR